MDEFKKTIRKVLSDKVKLDSKKADALRKETIQMFESKLKKVKFITWIFLAIDIAIMIGLAHCFFAAEKTKVLIMLAVAFLIVYESTVLIKLWYWIINTKLNLMKEVKHLQLQIAEMRGKSEMSND